MSRRTKLTPDTKEDVVKALRAGNSRRDSALYAGISEQTFYSWMKRGRDGEPLYAEFLEAVEKAEAQSVVRNVAIIQRAAEDTWQAAAWWLERKRPDDWGRRQRMDIGTSQEQPMKITVQIGGTPAGEE
tara:strand:+ start:1651 stop:2037 length:387 start_codon:yes stop_codon:yes gene_type:complete